MTIETGSTKRKRHLLSGAAVMALALGAATDRASAQNVVVDPLFFPAVVTSGQGNVLPIGNTVIGSFSGNLNFLPLFNTVIGNGSGNLNFLPIGNTVIGDFSGNLNFLPVSNEVIGDGSGNFNFIPINNTFIGDGTGNGNLIAIDNTVLGNDSFNGNSWFAINNTVIGDGSSNANDFGFIGNDILGDGSGNNNGPLFISNTIIGDNSGNGAGFFVTGNNVVGDNSGNGYVSGASDNNVFGNGSGNDVNGDDNTAIGNLSGNGVLGVNNIAIGTGAGNGIVASNTIAMGTNTVATQSGGVAIGGDSFGNGATSTLTNQFVLGTENHTYTAPGITSDLSRSRQSGPLELVTSDAAGNLATDGGALFEQVDENTAGIALAIAMENPDLVTDENFGIAAHWGHFDGANAAAVAGQAVLARNAFRSGDRIAASASFGYGFSHGNSDDTWGVRAGGQYTWK